jgi:single-strand DNA-binding protein
MATVNKVFLLGNVTRNPEVRYTPGGTAVCDLGLAVNEEWFDKQTNQKKQETVFVDVTLWGRTAEIAGEFLAKGKPVHIEGKLKLDSWDDKETGQKRSKLKVTGERLQLLGNRDPDDQRPANNPEGYGEENQDQPEPTSPRFASDPPEETVPF